MKVDNDVIGHRRLRAPLGDGELIVEPSFARVAADLAENVGVFPAELPASAWANYDCQGRRLFELARSARRDLLSAALDYTGSYHDISAEIRDVDPDRAPFFLAGHQPELFHPGVWCKNFSIARLAKEHRGIAIHLLIDSDNSKISSIRVPGGGVERPTIQSIPLGGSTRTTPYEEHRIADRECFESFGRRAAKVLAPLVSGTLLDTYWPQVVERSRETDNLGRCLSQARHRQEMRWGLSTLEVPQSAVCRLESFGWFAAHLLAHLPRLHEIYNSSVAEYRQVHRIRSAAHPVPDLAVTGDWLEAPFWIWSVDDPLRRRLFARREGGGLLLSDQAGWQARLELNADSSAATAVEQLTELAATGIKIRTRALITTTFARLLLGDLFVHGIGGAKYDELTDLVMARFFGFPPPKFMTVSGTLRLPIFRRRTSRDELRAVEHRLRELRYHPERFVDLGGVEPGIRRWAEHKRRWIETTPTHENARERHRAICDSNEAFQPSLKPQAEQLRDQRTQLQNGLRAETILASREYPFCFYPEKKLRDYLLDIFDPSQ